jgi:hypothetical protein
MEETMRLSSRKYARLWAAISSVVLCSLGSAPAQAQVIPGSGGSCACPYPAITNPVPAPPTAQPSTTTAPSTTTTPSTTTPSPAGTTPSTNAQSPEAQSPFSTPERSAALGGTTGVASDTGYIDSAIPRSEFRLRYEAAYDNNRPDRAEFFYAKCGCFGGSAPGPRLPETKVDYQDISGYLELAASDRFSAFVEAPVRFLNPEQNANTAGFADMNFGAKAALIASPDQYLTFQLKTYLPTGDSRHGLGTDHVSLEPGLLFYQKLAEGLRLEAELRHWIPIGGTDFAGNILRYGLGVSYDVYKTEKVRLDPVIEFVGWTVLNGKESASPEDFTKSAAGDTIVNGKFGLRAYFGENSSIYAGYGRALTGDVWYKDIFRVEYRLEF